MIPRAVTQIFTTACELKDKGWQVRAIFIVLSFFQDEELGVLFLC